MTHIRPASALADRLLLEHQRAARHGVRFSVLAVHHFLWSDDGPDARKRLDDYMTEHVAEIIRVSDGVYRGGVPGGHVVVLPHTPPAGADVVIHRLTERAREFAQTSLGPVSIERISVEDASHDTDALLRRIARHFRERLVSERGGTGTVRTASRHPVGNGSLLEEALHTEINLAGRDGTSLSVVALHGPVRDDAVPGLLACDVDEIASSTVRGCDQVFEIGPSCVALILARTRPAQAEAVAGRLLEELRERDPQAPYAPLDSTVFEFDLENRDATAFLARLRALAGPEKTGA